MYSKEILWSQNSSLNPKKDHQITAKSREEGRSKSRADKGPGIRLPSVHIRLRPSPPPSAAERPRASVSSPPDPQLRQNTSEQAVSVFRSCRETVRSRNISRRPQLSSPASETHSLPPIIGAESFLPFQRSKNQCQHCGLYIAATQTFARHEKWCSKRTRKVVSKPTPSPHDSQLEKSGVASHEMEQGQGKIVARVVTVGLVPGQIEQVFFTDRGERVERPKTRTLPQSSLQHTGHGLPSHNTRDYSDRPGMQKCENCDRIVASDKIDVHQRVCQSVMPHMSTRTVTPPFSRSPLHVGQGRVPEPQAGSRRSQKPPTVVCYICGREYGSKSIAIHEPQCLKKFNIQNNKLPIKDRLPLPKKKKSVAIVRQYSREEIVVVSGRMAASGSPGRTGDMVQRYFENCYSEFKKDLVPCKKCGRTFAPERHHIHEPNCNAKPLKL